MFIIFRIMIVTSLTFSVIDGVCYTMSDYDERHVTVFQLIKHIVVALTMYTFHQLCTLTALHRHFTIAMCTTLYNSFIVTDIYIYLCMFLLLLLLECLCCLVVLKSFTNIL